MFLCTGNILLPLNSFTLNKPLQVGLSEPPLSVTKIFFWTSDCSLNAESWELPLMWNGMSDGPLLPRYLPRYWKKKKMPILMHHSIWTRTVQRFLEGFSLLTCYTTICIRICTFLKLLLILCCMHYWTAKSNLKYGHSTSAR